VSSDVLYFVEQSLGSRHLEIHFRLAYYMNTTQTINMPASVDTVVSLQDRHIQCFEIQDHRCFLASWAKKC